MNDPLEKLMFEELRNACRGGGGSGGERGADPLSREVTESVGLEEPSEIIESSLGPTTTTMPAMSWH